MSAFEAIDLCSISIQIKPRNLGLTAFLLMFNKTRKSVKPPQFVENMWTGDGLTQILVKILAKAILVKSVVTIKISVTNRFSLDPFTSSYFRNRCRINKTNHSTVKPRFLSVYELAYESVRSGTSSNFSLNISKPLELSH